MRGIAFAFFVACGLAGQAAAQEAGPLKPGTEYSMKRTAADGTVRTDSFAVGPDQTRDGRTYAVVQRSDGIQIWLRRETRALAFLVQDGKTIESYAPDWGDWRWPLKVGETWSTSYDFIGSDGRRASGSAASWKVAAEEEVAVPAGTFKTLRIERTPGNQSNHIVIRWYAPEIGLVVKQIDRRTNQRGDLVQELAGYKPAP